MDDNKSREVSPKDKKEEFLKACDDIENKGENEKSIVDKARFLIESGGADVNTYNVLQVAILKHLTQGNGRDSFLREAKYLFGKEHSGYIDKFVKDAQSQFEKSNHAKPVRTGQSLGGR